MLRPTLFLAAAMLAMPLYAQAPTPGAAIPGAECLVRINATPQSWLIQGYDPFDGAVPEGTFGVTFENERSEEHTSELQSLMRISYAVFCLKKNKTRLINQRYQF